MPYRVELESTECRGVWGMCFENTMVYAGGEAHCGPDFPTGAFAALALKQLSAANPRHRYRVRRSTDADPDAWKQRELSRMSDATYTQTPWHLEDWYSEKRCEHFTHLSLKEPGKVSYTETPDKGREDRQTIIAPGRYLTKHFGDVLSADEIERWAAEVSVAAAACELRFTQDADEIEAIYVNGPGSCMSESADDYNGSCHPTRVYAGPDLALAYLGDPESGVSGRCVVWPEKKLYSTIYGDRMRIERLLQDAGYGRGSLHGARVRRITNGCNSFVMPYVDSISYCRDDGTFIVLGDGPLGCQSTTGETEDNGTECERCGGYYDPENEGYGVYTNDGYQNWCDSCGMHNTTYAERESETYADDDVTVVEINDVYHCHWTVDTPWNHHVLTGRADAADVVYIEDRDEYWTQRALDLCTAVAALAVHFGQPELPLAA